MSTEISQYMTFELSNVDQIREVLEASKITKIPTVPRYVLGGVHVRGKAIPATDSRLRPGLPAAEETVTSQKMDLLQDDELADNGDNFIELDQASILPPPHVAKRWRSEFIRCTGRQADEFLIILDVNAVFASDQSALVADGELQLVSRP